jgi:hypothetical protein
MYRLPRLLLALALGASLFPVGTITGTLPAEPVQAAPGSCFDAGAENWVVSDTGDASGTTFFCDESGGGPDATEPPVVSGPYCASGWGTWNNPLTIDEKTGGVIVAPGTTSVSTGGKAGSPALKALYNEARRRAYLAARAAGGIASSFYWQTGIVELTAMILQIEPRWVRGDSLTSDSTQWRFYNMSGAEEYRRKYWLTMVDGTTSREVTRLVSGRLSAEPILPRFNEFLVVSKPSNATRIAITTGSPTSWVSVRSLANPGDSAQDIEDAIFRYIGGRISSLEKGGVGGYDAKTLADLFFTPSAKWRASDLPTGSLKSAYMRASVKYPSASDIRLAVDLRYTKIDPLTGEVMLNPETGQPIVSRVSSAQGAGKLATLPDGASVGITIYTPARQSLPGARSSDELESKLTQVVERNLSGRVRGQLPFDVYGNVSKPENKYAFPVFHAPSVNTASASVCVGDEFDIPTAPRVRVRHSTPWVPGSPNACFTRPVSSLAAFSASITDTGECWLNWRIIEIPEPRFKWSDALLEFLPQVNVKQTMPDGTRVGGAVYDPIVIPARRNSSGFVSYLSGAIPRPIARSTTNKSNAVATLATYYNVTQVGVTAEVGVPGSGGFITQGGRVARTTDKGTEYDLKLTFTQTPLERLQSADCRSLSVANLLRYCGIGYDAVNKEWYYNVRIRTWYGGVYYAPGAEMNDPKLRGLFNPFHTVGINAFYNTTPRRIRNFAWPGDTTGYLQQTAVRFPGTGEGISSPLFGSIPGASAADRDYLRAMVCMSDGLSDICGDPAPDPSRPAYRYTQPGRPTGAFYPLFDASGGRPGTCPVASDGTACAVKVYVRSRQPIIDR